MEAAPQTIEDESERFIPKFDLKWLETVQSLPQAPGPPGPIPEHKDFLLDDDDEEDE